MRPEDHDAFLAAIAALAGLEHLRQHERVTNADRVLQDAVNRFHIGEPPKVTHLVAAPPGRGIEPTA